jgi:RNA polymerase sigma-70 factor (ECF subfamily)
MAFRTDTPGMATDADPPTLDAPVPDRSGRAADVESWLTAHGDDVWRFALSRTRSRESAEEIVQETMLAALEGRAAFEGRSSVKSWLLGIAAHKIVDWKRRALRDRRIAGRHELADAEAACNDEDLFTPRGTWRKAPAAWGLAPDALGESERSSLLAALDACLEKLPPSLAEPVWLRDLLGVPPDEVCASLGISAANLWMRVHRARAALRRCVERSVG